MAVFCRYLFINQLCLYCIEVTWLQYLEKNRLYSPGIKEILLQLAGNGIYVRLSTPYAHSALYLCKVILASCFVFNLMLQDISRVHI